MSVYKSSDNLNERNRDKQSIFLAGSIENGTAVDWQAGCEVELAESFEIFNPRRGDWDDSWEPKSDNVYFARQVNWELRALEIADVVLMNFLSGSKSPISLLEFGLMAEKGKMLVVCPLDFWKKGNVDMVCQRFDIPQFTELSEALVYLKKEKTKLLV